MSRVENYDRAWISMTSSSQVPNNKGYSSAASLRNFNFKMLEGPSTTVASMPVQFFLANDIVGANQELYVCV